MSRLLIPCIKEDLNMNMVFIFGPRQSGKTTLVNMLPERADTPTAYFDRDYMMFMGTICASMAFWFDFFNNYSI